MGGLMENYQALANAVVFQAVQDYKCALKLSRKRPHDKILDGQLQDLRKFFNSQWFCDLTGVDGADIAGRIEANPDIVVRKVFIYVRQQPEGDT